MNDDDLMERTARGEEEAFRILVERWERPVVAFLTRMIGRREDARDLAQETFLRVFSEARRYERAGRFRSWLFRIAGNLARSRLRRRKIIRWVRFEPALHDRPADNGGADAGVERDERRAAVRAALSKLPERQRRAVILRRYEGMSHGEIAEAMNASIPAVESLLQRAAAGLRKRLAGEETI